MAKTIVEQLDPIFKAGSVAIYGASNNRSKWGFSIVERLVRSGYRGAIYPINPHEREILGLAVYPTIFDVPGELDLCVFAVPAAQVPQGMAEALQRRVRGGLVISGNFAETSPEGRALQNELVRIAREGGIRFVGPNCNGIWSSAAGLQLSGTEAPRPGPIALVSQSGVFGGYLASLADQKGYGLSKFISAGNMADLDMSDYLEYLVEDPDTKVVVLYVEGFPQGRRFMEVARQVVRRKPIIVYKGGRTAVGRRAVASHTGSLMVEDQVFDALCQQVGIIRAQECTHGFDMAEALATAPLPPGNRVAIISMTGGQCVVTSDSCAYLGLEVPELDMEMQRRLKDEDLAPHAPYPRNPIDVVGDFRSPMIFASIAEKVAPLPYIDGLICTPPSISRGEVSVATAKVAIDAAEAMAAIPKKYGKPLIVIEQRRGGGTVISQIFKQAGVPSFETPEECARAMWALARYAEIRRREPSP